MNMATDSRPVEELERINEQLEEANETIDGLHDDVNSLETALILIMCFAMVALMGAVYVAIETGFL